LGSDILFPRFSSNTHNEAEIDISSKSPALHHWWENAGERF
jgi:hypothetical protein